MAGLSTVVILMNAFRHLYENVDHIFQCMERLVGFASAANIVDTLFPSQDGCQISKAPGSSQINLATRSPIESHVVTESKSPQDTVDSYRYYLWLTLRVVKSRSRSTSSRRLLFSVRLHTAPVIGGIVVGLSSSIGHNSFRCASSVDGPRELQGYIEVPCDNEG